MILRLYAIRDVKAGAYTMVFGFANDGVSVRAVKDEMMTPGSMFEKHPGDFQLYCVGLYDQDTGAITGLDKPEFVVELAALSEVK